MKRRRIKLQVVQREIIGLEREPTKPTCRCLGVLRRVLGTRKRASNPTASRSEMYSVSRAAWRASSLPEQTRV